MKSPLAAKTFSSVNLKGLQALLVASLGILLKTSMMFVIRDCVFMWEDLLIPLLDTPHFKWSNGLIWREPGGQTFVPWGRFLLRMWNTVSMKGNIIQKKLQFSPKWVNISLCSVLQFSYPLLFKFFILHLHSYRRGLYWQWLLSDSPVEVPVILPANGHQY